MQRHRWPAPATSEISPSAAAERLVAEYFTADSTEDILELCDSAFTDYYLRARVRPCDETTPDAAESVTVKRSEFSFRSVQGERVGSAVIFVRVNGGELDGVVMRVVLEYSDERWLIDGSAERA